MNFILPSFKIVQDSQGQSGLRLDDALSLAEALAADPAQPFYFENACSFRTELMIGRLLTGGVPPELIHRVHYLLTENPVDGTDHETPALCARLQENPNSPTFHKLAQIAPHHCPVVVQLPGTDVKLRFLTEHDVLVQDNAETKGWNLPIGKGYNFTADAQWTGLGDHVTIALPVLNEKTGLINIKVVDPHLTTPVRLLSFQEWKSIQASEHALIFSGSLGKLEDIVVEDGCLHEDDLAKLMTLIADHRPDCENMRSISDMKNIIAQMDRKTGDHIAGAMRNIDPFDNDPRFFCGLNCEKFKDIADGIGYVEKRIADSNRADNSVTCDWTALSPKEQNTLMKKWVDELEPLAVVERHWKSKFRKSECEVNVSRSPTLNPAIG